jgi:hypothetical protein
MTNSFVCGRLLPDYDWPDTGGTCCEGVLNEGPRGCTCWVPEFNGAVREPDELAQKLLAAGIEPATRPSMCGDCAYRPDSPEKQGHSDYKGDAAFLEDIAHRGERFWCHDGLLLIVRWRHPTGTVVEPPANAYLPKIVAGVPYKRDGQPAFLCAGWAARRKALAARDGGGM